MTNLLTQAAVDIGNDSLKGIFSGFENLVIPNIIAEMNQDRKIKKYENSVLDGIHISLVSGGLKKKSGIYAVGNLAKNQPILDELPSHSRKTDNDQSFILLLTALAINAVKSGDFHEVNGVIESNFILSTGVPMAEADERRAFAKKLEQYIHEVEFLQTPHFEGKKVRIHIKKCLVSLEGLASYIHLSNLDNTLNSKTMSIIDIGGLTTDVAVIRENQVDNTYSNGFSLGVSPFIDNIIKTVQNQYQYSFGSRKKVVEMITHNEPQRKNHIIKHGIRTNVKEIVDNELFDLAKQQIKHLLDLWDKVPELENAYFIGGGSVVLRGYLESVLELEKTPLPISFLNTTDSIWSICESYFKIIEIYLNENASGDKSGY